MPILKQLVGSSQTKRRSRMDLTREMISSPLGDFRHTMHVGRSGDAFGDTSFLSSRSGEPPPPPPPETAPAPAYPHSPRPGLLSRTFRSSKRSQSVTRVDQRRRGGDDGDGGSLASPGGGGPSPVHVKNAMSLPFLNDEGCVDGVATRSLELEERSFGELTDLPETAPCAYRGGMKRAESVMSFHIDLGPSMLGEILGVMEKEEDDDLGYEEGKSSEGHASPPLSAVGEGDDSVAGGGGGLGAEGELEANDDDDDDDDDDAEEQDQEDQEGARLQRDDPMRAGSSGDLGPECGGPYTPQYTPEARPKLPRHLDSCSMSSSGSSAPVADGGGGTGCAGADTDSATFSAPPEEESAFSSFLDDEDDEIGV